MPETSLSDAEFENIPVTIYIAPDAPQCLKDMAIYLRGDASVPRNGIGASGDIISEEPNNILTRRSDGTLFVPGNTRQAVSKTVQMPAGNGPNDPVTVTLEFAEQVSTSFKWVTFSVNPGNRGFTMLDPQWAGTTVTLTFYRNDEWAGVDQGTYTPTTITANAFSVT